MIPVRFSDKILRIALLNILVLFKETYQYAIPPPTFEFLSPKGFRISIPDEPGIALVAFHGSINERLKGIEPGDFEEDIAKKSGTKWVYENRNVFLDSGDTLYYWIHVQHNDLGYRLLDRSIIVPKKSKNDTTPAVTENQSQTNPTLTESIGERVTGAISDVERLQLVDERLKLIKQNMLNSNDNTADGCVLSKTTVNGRQKVCSKALIFEENFDYFNWTKWQRMIEIPSDGDDAEFVSYQDFPGNCYITDGELHIVPTLLRDAPGYSQENVRNGYMNLGARCTSIIDIDVTCKRETGFSRVLPPVVSAKLRSKNFFSFRYGQVDIRAKLPMGDWVFPQLLLQPLNSDYGIAGYASGQLRIAFIRGNSFLKSKNGEEIDGRRLYGGAVLTAGEKLRNIWLKSKLNDDNFSSRFHTYTMVWEDNSITLAVDGKSYATFQNGFKDVYKNYNITHAEKWEYGDKMAPFDKEFYLEIGVSVGGISDFPDSVRSGTSRKLKPWQNQSPKAELQFWNDVNSWYPSWFQEKSGLLVDYVKVWAI